MNSSYGSFDHLDDWSWYAPGWNSTPSTNAEYGLDNDAFSTSSGDFAPMPSSWQTTSSWSSGPSGPCLTIPQHSQYNFDQGQQVWFVSDAHINNSGQPPSFGSERSRPTAEMMGIPPLPASTAASPPLDGSGITTDDQCTYPRNTTYDQLAVAPEFLQALFPSPSLPRRDPPSLYDDDGQPLQKQSPRFEHDIYTALWVRGEGVSRAGWCGFCSSWLKLKDSAYWYHLHYAHGIACSSGRPLDPPRALRWSRSANVLEARCGTCEDWVSIGKGHKMRTAYWRHAYKCMTSRSTAKPQGRSPRSKTMGALDS